MLIDQKTTLFEGDTMSKLFLAVVLAVIMGFGAMSVGSSDIESEKMPRCVHTPWGCV